MTVAQKLFAWAASLLLSLSLHYKGGAEVATNRSLDAIIAALADILMSAPARERQRLAQAIEQYAIRFPTAFLDLRNGHPAPSMRELFQELMDSVDAHPE
jgi:hypothetical protein